MNMKSTCKFAAFGLAAVLFASCSDNTSVPGTPTPAPVETAKFSFTENPAAELAARVHSYKDAITKAVTRVAADPTTFKDVLAMPEIPAHTTAKELLKPEGVEAGMTYQISGKTIDMGTTALNGNKIYVNGGATLKYSKTAGGNTIYVCKGGKLEFTGSGKMTESNDIIICQEGSVSSTNNDIVMDGQFFADFGVVNGDPKDGDINMQSFGKANGPSDAKVPSQNITFNNKTYINGFVRAITLTIGENAVAFFNQNVMYCTTANVNGKLHANKYFKTQDLNLNGTMSSDWAIRATNFKMAAGAKLTADYVRATDATFSGNCQLNISDKGVLTFDKLTTDNTANQIVLNGQDAVAVIKAGEFHNNGAETIQAIATPGNNSTFLLQFSKSFNGSTELPTFEDLDIAASYLDYDKATNGEEVKEIQETDPNGKWGVYQWTGKAANLKATPKLDIVAAVDNADKQSATCIVPANGKLYVAYHTYGNKKFGGNIEVATMTGNVIDIKQSFKENNEKFDYNHLTVEGNKLYLTGSNEKNGGMIAAFNLDGSYAIPASGEAEITYFDKKTGHSDGNCVALYKGKVIAASTRGYEIFANDFSTHTYVPTAGKAKHLATSSTTLYGLNFSDNANKGAQISMFDNEALENAKTYTVGEIAPDTAKNVIALDGTDLYVCKGVNGVSRYDANGKQVWNYPVPTISNAQSEKYGYAKGYANGVAVDANYVYVACGGYGLVVLDKATGKEICHRKSYTGKSANYVAVDNSGNIYVAYGRSRIQVFKVTATK